MRKLLVLIALLATLILGLTLVAADEPEPGSPEDNACNPGGVLYREENQDGCPSEWYWKAGWFLARFLTGEISRENFPKEFESVLPPQSEQVAPITTICHTAGGWTVCARSNQTGYADNGPAHEEWLYITALPCPATYSGLSHYADPTVQDFLIAGYGFTLAEVTSLNLTPTMYGCGYF